MGVEIGCVHVCPLFFEAHHVVRKIWTVLNHIKVQVEWSVCCFGGGYHDFPVSGAVQEA